MFVDIDLQFLDIYYDWLLIVHPLPTLIISLRTILGWFVTSIYTNNVEYHVLRTNSFEEQQL